MVFSPQNNLTYGPIIGGQVTAYQDQKTRNLTLLQKEMPGLKEPRFSLAEKSRDTSNVVFHGDRISCYRPELIVDLHVRIPDFSAPDIRHGFRSVRWPGMVQDRENAGSH
jgi:hypothetical protein